MHVPQKWGRVSGQRGHMQNRGNAGRAGGELQRKRMRCNLCRSAFGERCRAWKGSGRSAGNLSEYSGSGNWKRTHFPNGGCEKTVICRLPAGDAGLCRSGAAGADKRGLPEIWQRKNRSRRCRYFASGTGKGAAKGIYLQRIFVLSRCNGGGCADVSGSGGNLFAGGFPGKAHRGAFLCQYQRYFR